MSQMGLLMMHNLQVPAIHERFFSVVVSPMSNHILQESLSPSYSVTDIIETYRLETMNLNLNCLSSELQQRGEMELRSCFCLIHAALRYAPILYQWNIPTVMASFQAWKRSQLQDNRKIFEGLQPEVSESEIETLRPQVIVEEKNDDIQEGNEKDDFQENNEKVVIPHGNPKDDIHIFVCTDEADLRPLAVLINSSMVNAP